MITYIKTNNKKVRIERIKKSKRKEILLSIKHMIESKVGDFICIEHREKAILNIRLKDSKVLDYQFSCCCDKFTLIVDSGLKASNCNPFE
jgi:uncharacterized Zn finger protein